MGVGRTGVDSWNGRAVIGWATVCAYMLRGREKEKEVVVVFLSPN